MNELRQLKGRGSPVSSVGVTKPSPIVNRVFSLTTMRLFQPLDLAPYANILAYLQRVGTRPAYLRAMAKGDPDLTPMLK